VPTKPLPKSADLNHLKHQAKDLLSDLRREELSAYQRIREFHPKFFHLSDQAISEQSISLTAAQLCIAREYGYASWVRLRTAVAKITDADVALTHNERIDDEVFSHALDLLDEGRVAELKQCLLDYPQLVHQQVLFEGDNYFTEPTLIEFVAENPIRQGTVSKHVVEITKTILDAGAKDNKAAVESTLMLVVSGRLVREHNVQEPLLELLCQYGADPNAGLLSALAEGELGAARRLISLGASLTLSAAAAFNELDEVHRLLSDASEDEIQLALSLSAQHGRHRVVTVLLEAGANPNRYNPPGAHSHCTPLHSAAFAGHLNTVKALLNSGARVDIGDIHRNMTALDWAAYAKHHDVVECLTLEANT